MQSQLELLFEFPVLSGGPVSECSPFKWDMPTLPTLSQEIDDYDDYLFGSYIEHIDFMKPKQMVQNQVAPPITPASATLLKKRKQEAILPKVQQVETKKPKSLPQQRPVAPRCEVWWVNQNRTFENEKKEVDFDAMTGHLRCPTAIAYQKHVPSWEVIEHMKEGDIVIHYVHKEVRAVSRVTRPAYFTVDSKNGVEMEFHYVDLGNIVLLDPPPRFQEFGDALKRLKIKGGPLNTRQVNQGYIYRLGVNGLRVIQQRSACRSWPKWSQYSSL